MIEHIVEYQVYIKAVAVLALTIFAGRYSKWLIKKYFSRQKEVTGSSLTTAKFIEHFSSIVIYLVGIGLAIWDIPMLKPVAQSMMAGAGIFAIAIGFASQNALGNLVSGILILVYRPYVINDRITIRGDMRGVVEDISLRHTVIRNMENQRIIIPNSVINNEILVNSNYADPKMLRFIEIGISYDSDIDLAKSIIADEIGNHPLFVDTRIEKDIDDGAPKVIVRLIELGDSSVTLRGWAWAKNTVDAFIMQCDVLESIKKRFDREGIVIPFPQRTISYLNRSDQPRKQA